MKKYWFIFLTACSISTFCFNNVDAKIKEYDLANYPILYFKDYLSEIKLRVTSQVQDINDWTGEVHSNNFKVSYIIEIITPLSNLDHKIYISLLDKEGFEVAQEFISNVAANYTGTVRGSFLLNPKHCEKICGVELLCRTALS